MQRCPGRQGPCRDLGAVRGPDQGPIPHHGPEVVPAPGSTATALGLGQDLIPHFTTGRRNIRGHTRTAESSEATTVAFGGPTTSGVEEGVTLTVDDTNVGVVATITITFARTGRISSSTLKTSSSIINNTNSSTTNSS